MRNLRSNMGKKVVVLSLLLSLLSLLVAPVLRIGQNDNSVKYANWLRSQLGDLTSAAVESAFSEALKVDADHLDEFIEVFVDAYTQASLDSEPAPVTQVVIFALLKHRYHLLDNAVTPHLLLKSALIRTLNLQDRTISSLWGAFERTNAVKFGQQISTFYAHIASSFSIVAAYPISPRAP